MTVRVNDVIGVAGFALPGNYVDIMVNTPDEGGRRGDQDKAISKIVLERILVLAVAQEADRDATKPKVVNAVTLEVTPDAGRDARPRPQRRHAVAGAAQPGRSEAGSTDGATKADAAAGEELGRQASARRRSVRRCAKPAAGGAA